MLTEKDIDQLLENWDNWSNKMELKIISEEEAELQNHDNIQNV